MREALVAVRTNEWFLARVNANVFLQERVFVCEGNCDIWRCSPMTSSVRRRANTRVALSYFEMVFELERLRAVQASKFARLRIDFVT